MSTLSRVRQIDHTGDIGLVVEACSLKELFEASARAMMEVIADLDAVVPAQKVNIGVEAGDLESVFVRWLSEINFRHITGELLFSKFEVSELDSHRCRGAAWGEPIDPTKHVVHTEIKAITYHHLHIVQKNGIWEAQFIFDM